MFIVLGSMSTVWSENINNISTDKITHQGRKRGGRRLKEIRDDQAEEEEYEVGEEGEEEIGE